ncbi:MAG: hydroxyisourate hydrolase [Bacteroidia bacterium]
MSQITTHILDTSLGKPAAGVPIRLEKPVPGYQWEIIASGITNSDGRVPNLLPNNEPLPPSAYRLVFEIEDYFLDGGRKCFYPFISIVFDVTDASHYHVPLLLNPFGYSTYRGS